MSWCEVEPGVLQQKFSRGTVTVYRDGVRRWLVKLVMSSSPTIRYFESPEAALVYAEEMLRRVSEVAATESESS